MVATKTLEMFQADSPLLFQTPWLLADEDMGGVGWPFDCWVGWAYTDKYEREKPVVQMLQDNPPGPSAAKGLVALARGLVVGAAVDLGQALELL